MKRRRTVLTLACAAALLLQVFLPGGAPLLRVQGEGVAGGQEGGASLSEKGDTYAAYLARYADAARPRLPKDIRRANRLMYGTAVLMVIVGVGVLIGCGCFM